MRLLKSLLLVRSAYRKTNLELPIKMLDAVKQLAEQENITMSQWVERAIHQALIINSSLGKGKAKKILEPSII